MGDLVEFPRKNDPDPFVSVWADGATITTECDDPIHVFDARGEACRCGEHFWSVYDDVPELP